jgi:hypothetical protein
VRRCGLGHAGRRRDGHAEGHNNSKGQGDRAPGRPLPSSAAGPTACAEWRPLAAFPLRALPVRGRSRRSLRRSGRLKHHRSRWARSSRSPG